MTTPTRKTFAEQSYGRRNNIPNLEVRELTTFSTMYSQCAFYVCVNGLRRLPGSAWLLTASVRLLANNNPLSRGLIIRV